MVSCCSRDARRPSPPAHAVSIRERSPHAGVRSRRGRPASAGRPAASAVIPMESLADGGREARAVKKPGPPVEEVTADDGFSVEGDHTCQTAQPRQTHARRVDRRGPRLTADAYQEEPTDEREGEPADDLRGNQGAIGSGVDERCDEDVLVSLRRANLEGQWRPGPVA